MIEPTLTLEKLQEMMKQFPANPLAEVQVRRTAWVRELMFLSPPHFPKSEWFIIVPDTDAWRQFSDEELRWFCNHQWPESVRIADGVMTGINISTS